MTMTRFLVVLLAVVFGKGPNDKSKATSENEIQMIVQQIMSD
jgi:hypothetical protein